MESRSFSSRTVDERLRIIRQIQRDTSEPAHQFEYKTLVGWLRGLPSAATRETYFAALKSWSQWLVLNDYRIDDPTLRIGKPKSVRRYPRPVETIHLERLLASNIRATTRTYVLLVAFAGLRVMEVASISGHNVDVLAKTLRATGKGDKTVTLPLAEELVAEAKLYPKRGLWFPSPEYPGEHVRAASVSRAISEAFARIDVYATAHMIRHWFGTELLRTGTDIRVVQELMRHSSLATTALYTQVDDSMRRDAVKRLRLSRADRLL